KAFVVPYLPTGDPPIAFNCRLDLVQAARACARLFSLRAMRSFGEGKLGTAYEDLDACYRLGDLTGGGSKSLIEGLVASGLRNVALQAERSAAFSGKAPAERLRQRAIRIEAMPPPVGFLKSFDQGERLMALDAMSAVVLHGAERVFPRADGTKGAAAPHP